MDVCVPSTAKECVCKEVIDKAEKSCGKCEVRKKTAAGPCKGIRTCQPKDQKDCPDLGAPNCLACEKAEVIEGKLFRCRFVSLLRQQDSIQSTPTTYTLIAYCIYFCTRKALESHSICKTCFLIIYPQHSISSKHQNHDI